MDRREFLVRMAQTAVVFSAVGGPFGGSFFSDGRQEFVFTNFEFIVNPFFKADGKDEEPWIFRGLAVTPDRKKGAYFAQKIDLDRIKSNDKKYVDSFFKNIEDVLCRHFRDEFGINAVPDRRTKQKFYEALTA